MLAAHRLKSSLIGSLLAASLLLPAVASATVIVPELPQRTAPDLKKARKEAQTNYALAAKALEAGNGKEAKLYAKVAYATLPNASTAGLLCIALREVGENKDAFYHCLIALSLEPSNEEKKLIDATVADLGKAVNMGWANVQVTPKTAKVTVDGTTFEGSRVIGLSPGDHQIAVAAEGHVPNALTLSITPGVQIPALISLAKVATVAPPKVIIQKESDPSWMTYAGWSFIGVGGALAIATGVVQGAGLTQEPPPTPEEADNINVASFVMGGLGGALIVTGIVLLVVDPGEEPTSSDQAQLRYIAPAAHGTGVSLNLGGTF